jgi:hypothetical protein
MSKKSIYQGITLLIILTILNACKKSSEPFGENVIRYKVNDQQVEIKGKWSSFTNKGVNLTANTFNGHSFNISGASGSDYNKISLSIPNSVLLNSNQTIDTNLFSFFSCTIGINNASQQFIVYKNFLNFVVTNNSNSFTSGNFNGKAYAFYIGPAPTDSIQITDGYFDIAK